MYRGLRRLLLAAGLLALGTATHAEAANLIAAPSFNTEFEFLGYWENLVAGDVWTTLDFEDDPFSGSMAINNEIAGAGIGAAVTSPCLPVTPGAIYRFSAWQFTPSPQLVDGFAQIFLQWRDACPSGALGGISTAASSDATLAWTFFSGEALAPVGANGASLWLIAVKTLAGGTFSVYFDEAFVPEPEESASVFAAAASLAALWRRRGSARRDGSQQHRTAAC